MSRAISFKLDPRSQKVVLGIKNLKRNMKQGLRLGLFESGVVLKSWLKQDMLGTKTGIKYKSLRKRSSAKGESPASQTGDLRNSINFRVTGWDKLVFGYEIEYGKYVEENLNRPGLKNSIENNEGVIRNNLNRKIKEQIKK